MFLILQFDAVVLSQARKEALFDHPHTARRRAVERLPIGVLAVFQVFYVMEPKAFSGVTLKTAAPTGNCIDTRFDLAGAAAGFVALTRRQNGKLGEVTIDFERAAPDKPLQARLNLNVDHCSGPIMMLFFLHGLSH